MLTKKDTHAHASQHAHTREHAHTHTHTRARAYTHTTTHQLIHAYVLTRKLHLFCHFFLIDLLISTLPKLKNN